MRKLSIQPDAGNDLREESGAETVYAERVVVEHDDWARVYISGTTSETDAQDMERQTSDVLEQIEAGLAEHGGDLSDVVRVRIYVAEPHLTDENFEAIHRARAEFFPADSYPASTLVEVSRFVRDKRLIEIDADAVISTE